MARRPPMVAVTEDEDDDGRPWGAEDARVRAAYDAALRLRLAAWRRRDGMAAFTRRVRRGRDRGVPPPRAVHPPGARPHGGGDPAGGRPATG